MKHQNRLRVLRAEKRVTQLDLSEKARISITRYWKIENGYTDPEPEERARIAKALRVEEVDAFPQAVAS